MADWTKSMNQTFEYYIVDPNTWGLKERLTNVESCTISRDSTTNTLESASFAVSENLGECYIRVYLVVTQNGAIEKFPLGTFLVQTPSIEFDGKAKSISLDAYSPLLELKDVLPPLGYTVGKGVNVMERVYDLATENSRVPIVQPNCSTLLYDDFVANTDETWLTYLISLMAEAEYNLGLDELSRIIFEPKIEVASMQPVWTFNDDNSSILYPDVTVDRDLYGIPNVVQVSYSSDNVYYYSEARNEDVNSITSIQNRGREVMYRTENPSFSGEPTQAMLDLYARQLLETKSSLEYTVTYSHGYCPVRIGDCVRLNYKAAGLDNVKAKVTVQSITCESGCPVEETAVFTKKLWEA